MFQKRYIGGEVLADLRKKMEDFPSLFLKWIPEKRLVGDEIASSA